MNLNQLAVEICKHEGKKKQVDIAQVKEVLKVLIEILSEEIMSEELGWLGFLTEESLVFYNNKKAKQALKRIRALKPKK